MCKCAGLVAVLVVSCIGRGYCATDCSALKFFGYNAIAYQTDATVEGSLPAFGNLLKNTFSYATTVAQNYENADDANNNLYSTTEYLAALSGMNAGAALTHGFDGWVAVEYFNTRAAAKQAARDQALPAGQWGTAFVLIPSQNDTAFVLAVKAAYASSQIQWGGDTAYFLNLACAGVENYDAYVGNLDASKFCIIGPGSVEPVSDIAAECLRLVTCLDCSIDGNHDQFSGALGDPRMLPSCFDQFGADLLPSPCTSCSAHDDPPEFGSVSTIGIIDDKLYWYLRRPVALDGFAIYGRMGGQWSFVATVPQSDYADSTWFCMRSLDISTTGADCYYVETMKDNTPTGRSRVFYADQALSSKAKEFTQTSDFASNTWRIAQKSGGAPDVVLVAQQYGEIGGFDISDLWSYYTDQGLDVVLVTGSRSDLSWTDIRAAYASYYQYDAPPLLVLCGSIRNVGEAHPCPTSILDGNFFDNCHGCHRAGICRGDWDYTDVDDDGSPDGPLTRIPAESQSELDLWVARASAFDDGVNVDHSRHVAFVCGNGEESSIAAELSEIASTYRAIGYSPLTAIRETDYHTIGFDNAWTDFGNMLDAGTLELWVAGSQTNNDYWTRVFGQLSSTAFDLWSAARSREQGMIIWAPTCFTTQMPSAWNTGQCRNAWNLGSGFFDSPTSYAVAVVGSNNAGWGAHHKLMRSYLMSERANAVPGVTTVSQIAWQAVRNMIQDYPWLASHAKGLGVWGCDVKIQLPEVAEVANDGHVGAHVVSVIGNASEGLGISVSGATGGHVTVDIYDLRGMRVRQLCNLDQAAPMGEYRWNGTDSTGRACPSGVYLFRVRVDNEESVRKGTLAR